MTARTITPKKRTGKSSEGTTWSLGLRSIWSKRLLYDAVTAVAVLAIFAGAAWLYLEMAIPLMAEGFSFPYAELHASVIEVGGPGL